MIASVASANSLQVAKMMIKNPNLVIDHRRSSVASSCPSSASSYSSSVSSLSTSTEYSEPFTTPSSSPWSAGPQYNIDNFGPYPMEMKDLTEGAFANFDSFSDFNITGTVPLDAISNCATYGMNTHFSPYENHFSIAPSQTMNNINSSPSITLDFNTFEDIKPQLFIAEGFDPAKEKEDNIKQEMRKVSLYGPTRRDKKQAKRAKATGPDAATVPPGKFKCSHEECEDKKFRRLEHLKRHMKTHDKTGKFQVPCLFCKTLCSRADNCR